MKYVELVEKSLQEGLTPQDPEMVNSVLELNKKIKSKGVEIKFHEYNDRRGRHDHEFTVRNKKGAMGWIIWDGKEFRMSKGGMEGGNIDLGKFKKPADMLKDLLAMENDEGFDMPSWGTYGT